MLTSLLSLLLRDRTDLDVTTSAGVCVASVSTLTMQRQASVARKFQRWRASGVQVLNDFHSVSHNMRLLKQTLVCGLYTLYTSTTDDGTLLLQHRKTNVGILPIGI